jgi:hypothetical protein
MTNVLGLTGKEPVIINEQTVFCSLCSRLIARGDEAVAAGGGENSFLIHPDCALASFTQESRRFYKENVSSKTKPRRTRNQKKKVHTSTGQTKCVFCRKMISSGDTYVLENDRPYHNTGRNSCVIRFRRVTHQMKNSLW